MEKQVLIKDAFQETIILEKPESNTKILERIKERIQKEDANQDPSFDSHVDHGSHQDHVDSVTT